VITPYSESTNVDQILQKRVRDDRGKTIYARDNAGQPISNGAKRGVPLGDVWEIPYLNPKAKERVGYPTQKPVLLMEKIVELTTDPNDLVVDPFCGSGTTVVAAQLLGRRAIGIDTSQDAIELTRQRLANPIRTSSRLLERGRESYVRTDLDQLECLRGLDYHPVQRNKGIDAVLAEEWYGKPVCIRIQRSGETVQQAAAALRTASLRKGGAKLILVVTEDHRGLFSTDSVSPDITTVNATTAGIRKALSQGDSDETREVSRTQLGSIRRVVAS
jgi:site-specific DNA-methyltransferase (adenine-specific)